MEDHEDEELQMALRMSMQQEPLPEPKRSKPWDNAAGASSEESPVEDFPEAKNRKLQRELMAAAAEKRMTRLMSKSAKNDSPPPPASAAVASVRVSGSASEINTVSVAVVAKNEELGEEMPVEEANQLFSMVFGDTVSKDILAQWTNQGIRFSPEPETSMGLVQHEGGPCGVLAAIQGFVLKYLIFVPDEVVKGASYMPQDFNTRTLSKSESAASNIFTSLSEDRKSRALVKSMGEILFLCGSNKRAMIATLSLPDHGIGACDDSQKAEINAKTLEGLSIESASDLHKTIRVHSCTSQASAFQRLEAMIPFFQSRMGAMLFLISALLSRGLESVQADRDDPSLPLVTAPFGHASQEIVNLLLCGQAAPNVFDGRMDLGGGMFLMGISSRVEVGFLTLLESLNFCKVGQNLKCPKWPIWVVGSESHYTVLFALDTYVQDENELEERESHVRKAFDAQDQSGGGGFISVEGFHQVLREASINLPTEKLDNLCNTGFIVWSEFWQVLLDLDKSAGGLKDSTGLMGKKVFELYHFNGIAKSILTSGQVTSEGDTLVQRPRLTRLKVSVPPRWTPEEFMTDVQITSGPTENDLVEVEKPEPPQHAPLVDCIRTRWPRAVCNWVGDSPSIV